MKQRFNQSAYVKAEIARSILSATPTIFATIEAQGGKLPLPNEQAVKQLHTTVQNAQWNPPAVGDGIPSK